MKLRLNLRAYLAAVWLVLGAGTLAGASGTGHFYFVQITDTHWGARDGLALTRRIVEAVNDLPMPIAFVVHTGDITADCITKDEVVEEGLAIMRRLKMPVHYLPGNHDILKQRARATAARYQKLFGPLSTRAEYHGVVCLFYYAEPLVGGFRVPDYDPCAWLQEQLESAGAQPVLLFLHCPPVEDFVKSRTYPGWPAREREQFVALLGRYRGIKAVVAGHFHRDELHWLGNIPLYVSSSVARFWERQPSFRLFEYRDGRLGYWTIYL